MILSDENSDMNNQLWESFCSADGWRGPLIGSTLLTVLGVPSAAGTHRVGVELPWTSQRSPSWRAFAIYYPLLCKQDSLSNPGNAFWPVTSHFVSLVQTHCRHPDWKIHTSYKILSFLENCYVHLLPELHVKSRISAFLSPQWDMCITAWVHMTVEQG